MSVLSVNRSAALPSLFARPAVVAALLSAVAFHDALFELVHRWSGQEEYSHGFLIPVVSAWLLWARRNVLLQSVGRPSYAGVGLVLVAAAMHVVGELSAVFFLSQVGLVVTAMGIVLALGGHRLLRAAFIPLAYLLFAIPLPYLIEAKLTLQLQLISSQLGVFVIRLFQIPVYLDGNIIDMGTYKLQVVEACSGLRYLYPLLSLGFLAAYLFRAPLWQRATVFFSSIAVAVGMNGLRIGMVGILLDRWGDRMADGALHLFEGWVIFLACSALLVGEAAALAWASGRGFFDSFGPPKPASVFGLDAPLTKPPRMPLLTCLAVLALGGAAVYAISGRSEIIPERARFVTFPTTIGGWQGRVLSLDPSTERFLKVDDYLLADYSGADGAPINFYVAYYASQRTNDSPHSPIVCLPGGGWLITRLDRRIARIGAIDYPYNRAIIQNGSKRALVYYWFDERGRPVADEYLAKWYLLRDAILKNRTDGALIRLTTPLTDGPAEDVADQRMLSFMRSALPRLSAYLPPDTAASANAASLSTSKSDTVE